MEAVHVDPFQPAPHLHPDVGEEPALVVDIAGGVFHGVEGEVIGIGIAPVILLLHLAGPAVLRRRLVAVVEDRFLAISITTSIRSGVFYS